MSDNKEKNNNKSILKKWFGEDAGNALEKLVLVGAFMIFPFIFVAVPQLLIKLTTPHNTQLEIIKSAPKDTQDLVKQILDVRKSTESLLGKLEDDIQKSEKSINTKKIELDNLQKQHEILKLTSEQQEIIQKYNLTIKDENPSLRNWIKNSTNIFAIISNLAISALFFWIGIVFQKKRKKI